MTAWSIPQILFGEWVWIGIWLFLAVAILAIRHIRREPPPKPHPFFIRHKKAIRRVSDVFIICFVLAMLMFVVWSSFRHFASLSAADGVIGQMELRFARLVFSAHMTIASAGWTPLVGMLSVFQADITAFKRIVLLALCVLPAVFAAASWSVAFSELRWSVIPCGVLACVPSWFVNGPAVLTGRPFFHVMWRVMCRLRLVSGDYAEWW